MSKVLLLLALFSKMLLAENYEEKSLKDKDNHGEGFGLHTDIGYSSYLIELDSSEINSAIDYSVLEYTLGFFYGYERWTLGFYSKNLFDELKSNMYVVTTRSSLGEQVNINKEEYGFYLNYGLFKGEDFQWSTNIVYAQKSFKAKESYHRVLDYESHFFYLNRGIAISLVYSKKITFKSSWLVKIGCFYSQAQVKMSELVNQNFQDSYLDTRSNSLGLKGSLGYNYKLFRNLFLTLRADAWYAHFDVLDVSSRVGDKLPSAKLKEETFGTYAGFSWRF